MKWILAIDVGTTSTKAMIVGSDGTTLRTAQVQNQTLYPLPGHAEQDPAVLFQSVLQAIAHCTGSCAEPLSGIVFSCAMHSLIAVDARGEALTNAMIWSDTRSHAQAKRFRDDVKGGSRLRTTGTPLHPMSPFCKLLWLKENQPALFRNAYKFVSIKEYIFYHLTGQWHVDYSIASATGLLDVHQLTWSHDALSVAGIDEARLSALVSPYKITQGVGKDILASAGLPCDVPLIHGASDGCLANLGSGVMQEGQLAITIGTSAAVRTTSTAFQNDPHHRIFNYRLDEKYFVSGGASNNGTVVINWFNERFMPSKQDVGTLMTMAASVDAGAGQLLFLPYVFGERSPIYDPHARGVFFGLAQHHTIAHMLRAIVEGVCFQVRNIAESLPAKSTRIVASGGFSQSDFWVQTLADVLANPVTVMSENDASLLGAAMMGFQALSVAHDFKTPAERVFQNNDGNKVNYSYHFALFVELTNILLDKFDRLATQRS